MSNGKIKIECDSCHKKFEINATQIINGTNNPEAKANVITGNCFIHTCPHCGNKVFFPINTAYMDTNEKYLIRSESVESALLNDNVLEEVLGAESESFNEYLAMTPIDLITKILFLDQKLDLRLAYATLAYALNSINEMKDFKDNPFIMIYPRINSESNELELVLKNKQNQIVTYAFPMDIYDELKGMLKNNLDKIDSRYFNLTSGAHLFQYSMDYVDHEFQFLIISNPNGRLELLDTWDYTLDKYKVGSIVHYYNNEKLCHGEILKIKKLKLFDLPFNMETNNIAIWCEDHTLTLNGEDNIDFMPNSEVMKSIKQNPKKHMILSDIISSDLIYSNCALGIKFNNLNLEEINNLESNNNYHYQIEEINKKKYLKIYLNKAAIDNDDLDGFSVTTIENLLDYLYNFASLYDGLLITDSIDSYKFDIKEIVRLKYERIMCHKSKMRDLLDSLTNSEIEFIDSGVYKLIRLVYFDLLSPKQISEKYNVDLNKICKALDDGYGKLQDVIAVGY